MGDYHKRTYRTAVTWEQGSSAPTPGLRSVDVGAPRLFFSALWGGCLAFFLAIDKLGNKRRYHSSTKVFDLLPVQKKKVE